MAQVWFRCSRDTCFKRVEDARASPTRFLDTEIAYNKEPDGETIDSSTRRVMLRDQVAHCLEGALLAAAAYRFMAFHAIIAGSRAVRDGDHVLTIFRQHDR